MRSEGWIHRIPVHWKTPQPELGCRGGVGGSQKLTLQLGAILVSEGGSRPSPGGSRPSPGNFRRGEPLFAGGAPSSETCVSSGGGAALVAEGVPGRRAKGFPIKGRRSFLVLFGQAEGPQSESCFGLLD